MMTKYLISIPIIVKDGESCLEKCLKSFQPIADEFVIVDTGSKDRTKEIARKYTDKLYDFTWVDDFSAARNFSFEKCTGDFLFWVDSDDQLYPEDIEKFRALDLSDKEIVICNYEYGHDEFGNSIMTVPRERIIKRSLNLKWREEVHEYLPMNNCKIHISDISTHHFKQAGSSERNLRILERIVTRPDCSSRNLYYMGREYKDFGNVEKSSEYLKKFIERGDGFWEDVYAAHYLLAEMYCYKDESLFKYHLYKSLEIEDRRAEPYYLMGQYWESKQQWLRAIQWYEFCISVKRPKDLLAAYLPDLYTWKPCINLCVCYNNIGNLEKSFEWNEKALGFRPNDTRLISNKKILINGIQERKKNENKIEKKDGQGKKLNLSHGNRVEAGYLNINTSQGPDIDEVFQLDEIPYKDNTLSAILSDHALEYMGWPRIEKALKEWSRVLEPGGVLDLYVADIELCFKKYLEAPFEDSNFFNTRAWYKFAVYGTQTDQYGNPEEINSRRCGYSKQEIALVVQRNGFDVISVENYENSTRPNFNVPSMHVRAMKPRTNLKIGWIGSPNRIAAQTRIRVHAIDDWLKTRGFHSRLVNYDQIVNENYDIAIIGKSFGEYDFNKIKELKGKGKRIIADLCEDIVNWPFVNEILKLSDLVVCCSTELAKKVEEIGCKTEVIEDAVEV